MELYRVLQGVRHLPVLERADWLWGAVRKPVRRLLNVRGRGVRIVVGRSCPVRLPPEYCGADWFNYEPEAVAKLAAWVRDHPGGEVIDVGCSVGIMASVTLSSSPEARVLAVDSDLSSLRACERVCAYAGPGRLRVVQGLLSDRHVSGATLEEALLQTRSSLRSSGVTGDVNTTAFRCLGDAGAELLPRHSLDGLWEASAETDHCDRDLLVKCDVEGAELFVLQGARKFLARHRPQLLLSVHPQALPAFGHSVAQVRAFLAAAGYSVELLAVDHEEHWWCVPQERA